MNHQNNTPFETPRTSRAHCPFVCLVMATSCVMGLHQAALADPPFIVAYGSQVNLYLNVSATSSDGSVVAGRRLDLRGSPGSARAFRGSPGQIGLLANPSGSPGQSVGVTAMSSDGGVVVGGADQSICCFGGPVLWDGGPALWLPILGGDAGGGASDISADASVIVGTSGNSSDWTAVRWIGGAVQSLNAGPKTLATAVSSNTPEGYVIVVNSETDCLRWTDAGGGVPLEIPAGYTRLEGLAISADGNVIVGTAHASSLSSKPFRWSAATGLALFDIPAASTCTTWSAQDVSADGEIVLLVPRSANCTAWREEQSLLWSSTTGAITIVDALEAVGVDTAGWLLHGARAISDDGQTVVGIGASPSFSQDGWVAHFGCYADCDQSTGTGNLDIFDFLCWQGHFVIGDAYACDCDTSTGVGVCDVFDFLCFQNAFVGGCP